MVDYVLRPFRPGDAPAVHGLHARHASADLVDVRSTIEPVLDQDGVRRGMAAADWVAVAVDAAGAVVGWGARLADVIMGGLTRPLAVRPVWTVDDKGLRDRRSTH